MKNISQIDMKYVSLACGFNAKNMNRGISPVHCKVNKIYCVISVALTGSVLSFAHASNFSNTAS